ncbi:hypothetical protein ACJZ2D_004860 [Fusarium nematophilum]
MSCLKWPPGLGRNRDKSAVKLPEHKVVILGDEGVGKTALVIQFCLQHFAETYRPIIEYSYRKSAPVDEVTCILDILDTAGKEEYTHLRDQWITKGEAIILVYSIDSRLSFHKIRRFHDQIARVRETVGIRTPICLVGNKNDRVTEREVSTAEGSELALTLGVESFVECSAKDCVNVEKAFYDLIRALRAQQTRTEYWTAAHHLYATLSSAGALSRSFHRINLQRPVVRIAPNELSFSTLSSHNDIYSFKVAKGFLKSPLYDGFINGKEAPLVAIKDPVLHGKKRRLLSHAFSARALKTHEDTIDAYSNLFVQQVATRGAGPEGINMTQWYNWFSFDVVGDLAFGESFNCLRDAKDHFWVSLVFDHSSSIIRKDVLRRFPIMSKILEPWAVPEEVASARRTHYQYSAQRVKNRIETKTDRKDFMSYLLDAEDEDGLVNENFLIVTASTFVVAGSETTATALAGITYWLLKTPAALEKLLAEVQGRFDSYQQIRPDTVQDLPYLNACIKEGMRLFPPAPQGLPRVSPGAVVSDVYVPAGTEVYSQPIVMNRDPQFFHQPDEFVPERWLTKTDNLEASQPFLIGPRACIGRNLAYIEMRLLLAKLVFSFEMELVDQNLDWDRDTKTVTFWEKPDLRVQFTVGIGGCLFFVVNSISFVNAKLGDSGWLQKQGFGISPVMTAGSLGPLTATIRMSKTTAMLAHILVANSPQVLVSFLYMLYNNILTRQLVADELMGFLGEDGKKV